MFVISYLETQNGAEAARRAGYSPRSARFQASHLLTKPNIKVAIARGRKTIEESAQIRVVDVARRWWAIANASPADIVQSRRIACRYCHGANHEYQWRTEREYGDALDRALFSVFPSAEDREAARALIEAGEWDGVPPSIPRDLGGYGYSAIVDPAEDCPECDGLGHVVTHVRDTRDLSEATLALFDGVKETQHGIEVKFQDRGKALESIAKHLGMFEREEQDTPIRNLAAAIMAHAQSVPVAIREIEDAEPSGSAPAAEFALNGPEPNFDDGVSNVEVEP